MMGEWVEAKAAGDAAGAWGRDTGHTKHRLPGVVGLVHSGLRQEAPTGMAFGARPSGHWQQEDHGRGHR